MELGGVEVVLMERGAVVNNMMGRSNGLLTQRTIVAVDEIDIGSIKTVIERRSQVLQLVPTHRRHLVFLRLRNETVHIGIENPQTIHIALFRMTTQQLLTHTDAEYGLLQMTNHLVKSTFTQLTHSTSSLALTREHHPIGLLQLKGIVGQERLNTQAVQGIDDRADIAGVIFDYRYHRLFEITHSSNELIVLRT